jgi:hypothetical protein
VKYGVQAYNTFVPAVDVTLDQPAPGEGQGDKYVIIKNADGTETKQAVEPNPNDPHEVRTRPSGHLIYGLLFAEIMRCWCFRCS